MGFCAALLGSGVTGMVTVTPSGFVHVTDPEAAGWRKPPWAIWETQASESEKHTASVAKMVRSGSPGCHDVVGSCTVVAIWSITESHEPWPGTWGTKPTTAPPTSP